MKPLDYVAAILASIVWGVVFIGMKLGVQEAPPFLMTALRFGFAAFPLVLFVRPPKTEARWVLLYGLLIGVAQFGLIFLAIHLGMPAGLASLVIQAQVFFTILCAVVLFGQRPTRAQMLGGGVALAGLLLIGAVRLGQASFVPFLLTLLAGLCWGAGNIVGMRVGRVDPIALIAWSSLVAPLPMFALSYVLEPARTIAATLHPSLTLALSVAGLAYGGTLFAYGLWAWLLARHPAAVVTPFALLSPVIGMVSARLVFGEQTSVAELIGALLVMAGLVVNVAGARIASAISRGRFRPAS